MTNLEADRTPYREKLYKRLEVEEIETHGTQEIPVFPLIRKATGLRLRTGEDMEYALSIISDSQPQLNLLGHYVDRISSNQIRLLVDGIIDAGVRWLNMVP